MCHIRFIEWRIENGEWRIENEYLCVFCVKKIKEVRHEGGIQKHDKRLYRQGG